MLRKNESFPVRGKARNLFLTVIRPADSRISMMRKLPRTR